LQSTRNNLFVKEQELENVKHDLQVTKSRLDTKEQAIMDMKKDLKATRDKFKKSQEVQSQLKTALIEKGRELDEVRKNAAENNKTVQEMIQQLKERLEGTEQSLQDQLKVNTQLQLQVETIFNSNWSLQLNYLVNSDNVVIPVVSKLTEFKKYKNNEDWISPGFYTSDKGYKICLRVFPDGISGVSNHVTMSVRLMKGDHDDHLKWPFEGTLTVQLLNQLSDSNHSELVEFNFVGSRSACERVKSGTAKYGMRCDQFMTHRKLSYDAYKKCQYLKDDCVFFRVCNFQ